MEGRQPLKIDIAIRLIVETVIRESVAMPTVHFAESSAPRRIAPTVLNRFFVLALAQ